jgi:hypothetical protein
LGREAKQREMPRAIGSVRTRNPKILVRKFTKVKEKMKEKINKN